MVAMTQAMKFGVLRVQPMQEYITIIYLPYNKLLHILHRIVGN